MKRTYWFLLFTLVGGFGIASPLETAEGTLRQAEFFADRYAWGQALPLFVQAEKQFLEAANAIGATYARLGRIRASVKEHTPQQIYDALDKEIGRSPLRNDSFFCLRALFLKADTETDIDSLSVGTFNADQRRRDWQEILALSQKLNDQHLENRAQGELGLLNIQEGDQLGFDAVTEIIWQANETGDVMNELHFRTAVAALYRSAGRIHDALGHLDRSVELADRDRSLSFFPAYYEKALTLFADHRLQEALPLVERCAAQAHITGSVVNNAQALYLKGKVHREDNRLSESVDLLKQALDLASEVGFHRLISMASLELSQIYRTRSELRKALDYAELGLQSSLKAGDPMEAIIHMHNKGTIRAEQGHLAEADCLYGDALGALNVLLAKLTNTSARAFMVSKMSDLFSDYFSFSLFKLKDPGKAFIILEQARGRSVSDSLRGRWIESTSAHEKTDQNPSGIFEKSLARLQAQLWHKKQPQEFRRILSDIFDLEQNLGLKHESSQHNIEVQTFPPVPLAEVQKALYPDEVILEYVLREPSSTCLAISRGGVQGIVLPPRHVIEESIAGYREEILQGWQGSQIARSLYDLLLAPIAGLDQKQRITIIPDGLLHLLPFEAILTPAGGFLINSYMIDCSPAATVTMLLRQRPAKRKGRCRFLGVGDPRYPSFDESGSVFFANMPQPARLPGSRTEISSITRALKDVSETVTLLGEGVNEAAIKALNLSDFDILHFAVHGTSDINFPARSALLFGPGSDGAEDGIFQAWEISRLRLKTDLVVLSACDTAVGRLLDQEGVSNLVQSFLLAGARSVVASIWPTEDHSTADLMARFYSYLAQGMDKGSALRQAKLDFIEKYKDKVLPIYWAGMLMIGDSSDSILKEHQGNDAGENMQ
jgi:CHAT domain-containing protein